MKHNIKIFSGFLTESVNRMHSAGKDNYQIFGSKAVSSAPHRHQDPASDTIDQLEFIMPVEGKRRDELRDPTVVNSIGKGSGSVGFGFVNRRMLHRTPQVICSIIGLC